MRRDAMSPRELRDHIKRLDPSTPRHKELEKVLKEGVGFGNAWYSSQKEHWLGWLAEYEGPGAYGRQTDKQGRDAEYVYNHIQCAPMLFWLIEALGFSDNDLDKGYLAVVAAPKRNASQCAALRKVVPWERVATALAQIPNYSMFGRLFQVFRDQKGSSADDREL
jgi:hypothetical protein